MSAKTKVCIIGQALVDVTFLGIENEPKLRLGGIAHAGRALWALNTPYVMAYCAPQYLDDQVLEFASGHAGTAQKIGEVIGCPNVVTVGEPTEAGQQRYEYLLRDEQKTSINEEALRILCEDSEITDFLVFPGGFPLEPVLRLIGGTKAGIHIDMNFEPDDTKVLASLGRPFDTLILSTSSDAFLKRYGGAIDALRKEHLPAYGQALVFKENRGGSRFFSSYTDALPILIKAQNRHVLHSIGVGDCFDAVYVVCRHTMDNNVALSYASSIAAEYASTTHPDDFKAAASGVLQISKEDIVELAGVSLPWETRPECHIYIAAPDFNHVDRKPIERIIECLKYHNFSPRRPVIENGEMGKDADAQRRQRLCDADLQLMGECRLMIAVLLFNDPGTLIEIGLAVERGMPVLVYDPYNCADNLMLTQLPNLVSSNLDEIISGVFKYAALKKDI